VPSLLRAMMQEVSASEAFKARLSGLTWMMVTGEALPPDLADDWLRTYPEVGLMNAYGPTECSDDVTHYVVGEMPFERITYMPIGRPIINTEIYILDKYQMPVPTGVDGEVYVGGAGVGRGYLNE